MPFEEIDKIRVKGNLYRGSLALGLPRCEADHLPRHVEIASSQARGIGQTNASEGTQEDDAFPIGGTGSVNERANLAPRQAPVKSRCDTSNVEYSRVLSLKI